MQVIIAAVSSVYCNLYRLKRFRIQSTNTLPGKEGLEDFGLSKLFQFYFIKTRAETSTLFPGAGNQGSVAISAATVVSVWVIASVGSIAQTMITVAVGVSGISQPVIV